MRLRVVLSALGALAFTLGSLVPASGAQPTGSAQGDCVDVALERALDAWSCLGGQLSYERVEAGGDSVTVREQITMTSAVTDRTISGAQSSAGTVAPLATPNGSDDWWCESGQPICTTKNDYQSKTKGNVAYGNSSGVVGTYDIVISSNLNGRSSKATVQLYRDSGPSLTFSDLRIVCDHVGNAFGCGSKYADKGDGRVYVSKKWIGPEVSGNKLAQTGRYNDRVTGKVTPAGAPVLIMPSLAGAKFDCKSGSELCTFP